MAVRPLGLHVEHLPRTELAGADRPRPRLLHLPAELGVQLLPLLGRHVAVVLHRTPLQLPAQRRLQTQTL